MWLCLPVLRHMPLRQSSMSLLMPVHYAHSIHVIPQAMPFVDKVIRLCISTAGVMAARMMRPASMMYDSLRGVAVCFVRPARGPVCLLLLPPPVPWKPEAHVGVWARLQELRRTEGTAVAAVPLPVDAMPAAESEAELLTLYIADFLHSFQKALDLPRLTLADLREGLSGDPEARGTALLRQAMHGITAVCFVRQRHPGSPIVLAHG